MIFYLNITHKSCTVSFLLTISCVSFSIVSIVFSVKKYFLMFNECSIDSIFMFAIVIKLEEEYF